jgi:hypothetical protein
MDRRSGSICGPDIDSFWVYTHREKATGKQVEGGKAPVEINGAKRKG